MITKIVTLVALLIALFLVLYRGDETVNIVRSLGGAATEAIRTLQGR